VHVAEYDIDSKSIQAAFMAQGAVTPEGRLRQLRERIRTDDLNNNERRAIMNICEHYNDVFKLPGDKLTVTTAAEHAIPTPGVDPCRE
jgi:hypothetical protein